MAISLTNSSVRCSGFDLIGDAIPYSISPRNNPGLLVQAHGRPGYHEQDRSSACYHQHGWIEVDGDTVIRIKTEGDTEQREYRYSKKVRSAAPSGLRDGGTFLPAKPAKEPTCRIEPTITRIYRQCIL